MRTTDATDAELPSRRRIIRASLVGLAMLSRQARASPATQIKPVRFVHLTDVHACGLKRATEGFAAALASIAELRPAPDFIITGGDHGMDAFSCAPGVAAAQWDLYTRA